MRLHDNLFLYLYLYLYLYFSFYLFCKIGSSTSFLLETRTKIRSSGKCWEVPTRINKQKYEFFLHFTNYIYIYIYMCKLILYFPHLLLSFSLLLFSILFFSLLFLSLFLFPLLLLRSKSLFILYCVCKALSIS